MMSAWCDGDFLVVTTTTTAMFAQKEILGWISSTRSGEGGKEDEIDEDEETTTWIQSDVCGT